MTELERLASQENLKCLLSQDDSCLISVASVKRALKQESTNTIDYCRAFKIACDLLNGDILYGVDTDKIYELMMQKDGVVSSGSYEEYILNHLQELDQGQYASSSEFLTSSTTKNYLAVDCVDRREIINQIFYSTDNSGDVVLGSALRERIEKLPSATPHKPTTKENLVVSNIIDDIEGLTWYRVANGQLTEGANSKTDTPLYKACDIEKILEKYRG